MKIKLKSMQIEEREANKSIHWKMDNIIFDDLNLIIGPNASGKTQFFKRMAFLRELHKPQSPTRNIRTTFKVSTTLNFSQDNKDRLISYNLIVAPGPLITEQIFDGEICLFKSEGSEAILFDEISKSNKPFLYNNSTSITKQVRNLSNNFKTIVNIGDFFQSILILNADKFNLNNIRLGKNEVIPSDDMDNISSVVLNWQNTNPHLFKELFNNFKNFFDFVESFDKKPIQPIADNITGEILAIKEVGVSEKVELFNMSSGMVRILTILALPLVRLMSKIHLDPNFKPSMILIDEIDNGLDYERIGAIIDHLKGESAFYQIIVSSHSPVVCNFIPPENWRVFRRKGVEVKITSPLDIKETTEFIEKSKKSNWELYKSHISKSGLYSIN